MGLLDDLRRNDPDGLHRFLWSNHLAYAASYEVQKRFGVSKLNPSRQVLFADMVAHLRSRGLDPRLKIRSVFEVGCSMGYLLRHLEVEVCPSAEILHGLDIDAYAVEVGMAHLRGLQSKVRLFAGDMSDAERIMGSLTYDILLCCGVLMYVNEAVAYQVVRTMLSHANYLVGIICLAAEHKSSASSRQSVARSADGAFTHDLDRMIRLAGGDVVSSKWIGTDVSGSSPSYAILAEPAHAGKGSRRVRPMVH
jgi:SAM-dependent methyltransferase